MSRLESGNIIFEGKQYTIEEYRSMISARSLYNFNNEYEITGDANSLVYKSLKINSNVSNSINSILGVIPQWQGISNKTSILNRLLPNQTPLAEIGTIMLAQQFFYNSMAHLAQQNLPSLDLNKALQGKNPFSRNVNWSITDKDDNNKSFLDKVGGFVSNTFFNTNTIGTPPDITTNSELIKNTGKAQLSKFYENINLNLYRQVSTGGIEDSSDTIIKYALIATGDPLVTRERIKNIDNKKTLSFSFDVKVNNPYFKDISVTSSDSVKSANESMVRSYMIDANSMQMYAPDINSVIAFGNTVKSGSTTNTLTTFINTKPADELDEINKQEKLIWGRDGLINGSENYIAQLRGDDDAMGNGNNEAESIALFGIKKGLLEYTKNLLNATEGKFVDITRKAFKDGNEIIGFNGSPLWQSNDSTYSRASNTAGKTGIRQHTILDPYNRFAKAIRFNGNNVYGGNPNSVIYDTVLPRIHPTKDDNGIGINNKNLMFSIENLAIGTIKRDTYGVIDDEWGTAIPLSEVGPFAGRLMWFPPYDLQLNETASAKFDSTVMVGRNEPMYNYQNSERTATLSFTLLIDYPEQLRNYISSSNDKNKTIADFFAFGGDPLPNEQTILEYTKQIEILKKSIPEMEGPVKQTEPNKIPPIAPMSVYFPNDTPSGNTINTIIDDMYNDPRHYEIIVGCESQQDGNGFGLNEDIYYREGLADLGGGAWLLTGYTSQYNVGDVKDQLGDCKLNKALKDTFTDKENLKYYSITIEGRASKLYLNKNQEAYNKALGQRRIEATAKFVKSRLKAIFPDLQDADLNNVIIKKQSIGSEGGSVEGEKPENMALEDVKKERSATITIARNNVSVADKKQTTNQSDDKDIAKIKTEIEYLTQKVAELQNVLSDNIMNKRNKDKDAILYGYTSISGDYFYPAFHSQTPEEFHRRLTFLQQCVRQGAAKRYDVIENGELRARNSVFGRQPICILRVGDFLYTKVVIDNVTFDYNETTWDTNPEGFGMQPMIAKVTLQMKVIGGQSLKGPIDALQNAASFNYYANSTFSSNGMYSRPSSVADNQDTYMHGINGNTGIVGEKTKAMTTAYENLKK